MVCSKCGAKLKEGDLFCLTCGQEVQIVPDYSPVEELVIKNLLDAQKMDGADRKDGFYHTAMTKEIPSVKVTSNLLEQRTIPLRSAVALNRTWEEAIPPSNTQLQESGSQKTVIARKINEIITFLKNHKKRSIRISSLCLFILLSFILSYNIIKYEQNHSITYQTKMANKMIDEKNYEEAAKYLDRALILDSQSIDIRFQLASVYEELNHTYAATLMLNEIIQMEPENETAYERLIPLYEETNRLDDLDILLEKLSQTSFADDFSEYYLPKPSFSIESGAYDHVLTISLTAEDGYDIFYTLNGSRATSKSTIYEEPITLSQGDITIHAVAVNKDGQVSMQSSAEYHITVTAPNAPIVSLESGTYEGPVNVTLSNDDMDTSIEDETTMYYTLDGSDPVENGALYTGAITLAIGDITLSAVSVNAEGIASDVTSVSYHIQADAQVSINDAYERLVYDMGLSDDGGSYRFVYRTVVSIGESTYYIFDKTYDSRSNCMIAVDIDSGYHCSVVMSGNEYVLTP